MTLRSINAYREWNGDYQLVGVLSFEGDFLTFRYDAAYEAAVDAAPISASLPFSRRDVASGSQSDSENAEGRRTRFFDGLLPEERMRALFERSFSRSIDGGGSLLAELNCESSGALVFGFRADELKASRVYERLPDGYFERFAASPRSVALASGTRSKLSLAGAQSKVGLHRKGGCKGCGEWMVPCGSAPSTVIVKAPPDEKDMPGVSDVSANEALCLETARCLGFEVPSLTLIPVEGSKPLLAVDRFDRLPGDPFPVRLHQEDFCQAFGFPSSAHWKYEPTDGNYLSACGSLISQVSDNPFGDRMLFFQRVLFDYVVGNCDNHLKNHSFVWSSDWKRRMLSPLYDIICTTIYADIDREMGVSLCRSRRIDDVTLADIGRDAEVLGIPKAMGMSFFEEIRGNFKEALGNACDSLTKEYAGDPSIVADLSRMAERILEDARPRLRL